MMGQSAGYSYRLFGERRASFRRNGIVVHAYPAKTAPVCIFYGRKKTAIGGVAAKQGDMSPENFANSHARMAIP